jgi:sugar lactone lactonase YvrE
MFDAATRTLIEGLGFPEGPRWRGEHLYFSDFHQRRVVQARLDGTMVTALRPDDIPSGLGFMPNGDLLVVSMLKRALLRQSAEGLEVVADLRKWTVAGANDMAVDGVGRAYVGNFGFDFRSGESPRTTVLLRVDPSGDVTVVADELLFPNGVAIDDDRGTLIVAETYAHRLTAFDLAADGSLSRRRVFAQFGDEVYPDGICLDAEGQLWVATARSAQVLRVQEGGRITGSIRVSSGSNSYACMLGGDDGRTLFVCTAPGLRPSDPPSGRIEIAQVDVKRAGRP